MISLETKDGCTFFKVTGNVTANEIIMQAAQYMAGEQTDTSVWDFTQATGVKISTVEMKGIADSLKRFQRTGRSERLHWWVRNGSTSGWANYSPPLPSWRVCLILTRFFVI
jgi:hypothetical protein